MMTAIRFDLVSTCDDAGQMLAGRINSPDFVRILESHPTQAAAEESRVDWLKWYANHNVPIGDGCLSVVPVLLEPKITAIRRQTCYGSCTLFATFEGGSDERQLFSYYIDELSFADSDLIGLTEDEAHRLRQQRDIEYLRS